MACERNSLLPPFLPYRVHTTNPDLGKRAQKVDLPFIACDVCTLVMGEVKREGGKEGEKEGGRVEEDLFFIACNVCTLDRRQGGKEGGKEGGGSSILEAAEEEL